MLEGLADHIMNHHMVAAAGGGRHHVVWGGRRPPHIMWPASLVRLYFLVWPHIAFFCFSDAMRCERRFSALASYCIVFRGQLGPTNRVFSTWLYE